jgi:hypothetical protein
MYGKSGITVARMIGDGAVPRLGIPGVMIGDITGIIVVIGGILANKLPGPANAWIMQGVPTRMIPGVHGTIMGKTIVAIGVVTMGIAGVTIGVTTITTVATGAIPAYLAVGPAL